MSSLHEPQVGQALEPEVSATAATADLLNNQRNTRPFSASDECGGDLLTVLVHFGRNLGALVTKQVLTKLDTLNSNTVAEEQLNTYVVASVGAFAVSSDLVQCLRGRDAKAPDTSTPVLEGRVLYEQKFSPYAATRVVEGSTSPSWNEVLAIPLPAEWSESLTTNQQRPDRGGGGGGRAGLTTHTEAGKCLALKLELVERGDSHQEEFLLGTCILPLAKIGCQFQQTRLALAFPSAGTKRPLDHASSACVYVSLHATCRGRILVSRSLEHVEITVETFTPVVVTGNEEEGVPLDCTNLAALVNFCAGESANSSQSKPVEEYGVLENHFTLLQDGQALPELDASTANALTTDVKKVGIAPSSSSTTGSASGVYEWFFPFNFALAAGSRRDFSVAVVKIALFNTSSVPHKLVGRGQLQLSASTAQGAKKDGSPLRYTVIPITLNDDNSRVLGHIALRLRWWDTAAWSTFIGDIPARRVVCTNRWNRSPRPTIAWMGAMLRGLNRHPVASICDAGGVSAVLAELLAKSSSSEESKQNLSKMHAQQHQQNHQTSPTKPNSRVTDDTSALLREQLAHLQTEGTAQRLQIERLQNELDIRLAAIKTCGLEIVALRREARQKDEQLQKLKEQAEFAQRREQQQLAELLASTNGNGIAFPARPEHQAASQRFTLLATKYKELDHECQTVKQQLADAQRSLDSCADLETRHNKLQEAHLVQSALVQRLQRDKQHATTLKKAVRMQEKVIRQFEQTVAQQSTETPERPSIRQHAPETDTPDIDGGDSETREALLRVRVQVLEQQLQTNAREAAAEMSALRLRILELETAESRRTGK
ncbi:hypothetical protein PC129_g13120 [Phytophthora cactorum]|uniref:C2 domain-containing protein n=1 Tax=Phytophthora cactorum TaxID=29920 RepID=A0A329S1V5_9STRA|nr:hypothetical protein Pcac1_g5092 [Phytophthora cactorum]KAG2812847.1 hypothetical protein PC112_g14986 [Phytophthora cactorum]KAG2814629.1 hypothetical protein PC111_g13892 [Phytophthora cactorum]KAG2852323.1 hypothetical protein PC113_g15121 [Phytophthora cactorum]KAG2914359.1 hypothetical protein PC114_g8217 [Phytophthora cactorum]